MLSCGRALAVAPQYWDQVAYHFAPHDLLSKESGLVCEETLTTRHQFPPICRHIGQDGPSFLCLCRIQAE